jgi:D-alanine-D-alanine ligase
MEKMMKIKVGVFFGGNSVEHEVSVISGLQAVGSFPKEKYDVIPIYITKSNQMYVGELIGKIEAYKDISTLIKASKEVLLVRDGNKFNLVYYPIKKFGNPVYASIDVAFPVVHGTNVEDGTLQGYFKHLQIPFVGCDVLASAVGMDKYVMKTVLKEEKIPVLNCCRIFQKDYLRGSEEFIQRIEGELSYPVIVKPINLGSSVGIKIARDRDALLEAIEYAFQFAKSILVEKAITSLREINCAVLGNEEEAIASECEEPINSDEILSYQDKYVSGAKGEGSKGMSSTKRKLPADLTKEQRDTIRELAVKTFKALDCNGVARIDFMIDTSTDQIYVNEINTIPGSLAFYLWEAIGIKFADLLDRMVELALKRDRENKDIVYSFDSNILSNLSLTGAKGAKR